MITHPQKLPVLQHAAIWESRMQNAAKEKATADGALGCIASHTCIMFVSVLAKFACFEYKRLSLYVEAVKQLDR